VSELMNGKNITHHTSPCSDTTCECGHKLEESVLKCESNLSYCHVGCVSVLILSDGVAFSDGFQSGLRCWL